MMGSAGRLPRGSLWGGFTLAVGVLGVMGLLGLWQRPSPQALRLGETWVGRLEGEPGFFSPARSWPLALLALLLGVLLFGYAALPLTIVIALLLLLPSALRRPGLLVFVFASLLYLPLLGTYGLWDPWETHYGEVAREILARDDWISLWWAQENWFWSKPILIFWLEALSMHVLGVEFLPDAHPLHPEWALRLPIALLAIAAVVATYAALSRIFTKRAATLAALALTCSPLYFLLAHQAITDMPLVASMTIAVALLALALRRGALEPLPELRLFGWSITWKHTLVFALLLVSVPQALYLISRNITFFAEHAVALHADTFLYGSGGNADVPGNPAPTQHQAIVRGFPPVAQAVLWLLLLGVVIAKLRRERDPRAIAMMGFYFFCAIASMGKGLPGLALPGLVALLYLLVTGRWSLLAEGRLRITLGVGVIAVVALPWFVAMFVRHGPPFSDRLLVHDHIRRVAAGVHGDTGSIQYFIEQLGVGLFPWIALVPIATTFFLVNRTIDLSNKNREAPGKDGLAENSLVDRTSDLQHEDDSQRETLLLYGLWFFGAFVLFSAMATKFHHYIFPAVPPAAALIGVWLDRHLGEAQKTWTAAVLTTLASALMLAGIAGLHGDLRGIIPPDVTGVARASWVLEHGLSPTSARSLLATGVLLMLLAARRLSAKSPSTAPASSGLARWLMPLTMASMLAYIALGTLALLLVMLAAAAASITRLGTTETAPAERDHSASVALLCGVIVLAFVGRDLAWQTATRPAGFERLVQLFIYLYARPWPTHFDYRPILTAFALLATGLLAAATFARLRPLALRAFVAVAILFSAWTLDIYLIDLSPHWGQKELIDRYYEERKGPEEPLIAWQMNWKGENFYTGNRVFAFPDLDNKKLNAWIAKHRGQTVFIILEPGRLPGLERLLGKARQEVLTDARLCNKFILVRATL